MGTIMGVGHRDSRLSRDGTPSPVWEPRTSGCSKVSFWAVRRRETAKDGEKLDSRRSRLDIDDRPQTHGPNLISLCASELFVL